MSRHVDRHLAALADGELAPHDARRVEDHLADCARCRRERDLQDLSRRALDALSRAPRPAAPAWDGPAPGELPFDEAQPSRRRPRTAGLVAVSAAVLVAAALVVAWQSGRARVSGWQVAALAGAPRVDDVPTSGTALLERGAWLETDAWSRAELRVGRVGSLEVEPGSRLRLVDAPRGVDALRAESHRVELARGTVRARVFAPPRLFLVDTPSATAVDLGCAYALTVDERGDGVLAVTSGRVALERGAGARAREVVVEAGWGCALVAGRGPGTPCRLDAPPALRHAVSVLDRSVEPSHGDVAALVASAGRADALTLWHALADVEGAARESLVAALERLAPPPATVTREQVLALDDDALRAWRRVLPSR